MPFGLMFYGLNSQIMLLLLLAFGFALYAQFKVKSTFARYSQIAGGRGLTGAQVARALLDQNGLSDVPVDISPGQLTDHYDPRKRVMRLSEPVYHGRSLAALGVAAHETGHAIQHATAYQWLSLRSGLVPIVQFSGSIVQWILLAGIFLINVFPGLLLAGIIVFATTTLFALITLPVEFDASRRALAWLNRTNVVNQREYPKANDALKWAALTYVVAAVASIVTLIQYLLIYQNRDRR